jgi:hypothetical protein
VANEEESSALPVHKDETLRGSLAMPAARVDNRVQNVAGSLAGYDTKPGVKWKSSAFTQNSELKNKKVYNIIKLKKKIIHGSAV